MSDGRSKQLRNPPRRGTRWTSFVAMPSDGPVSRGLQEQGKPGHRLRVEHNPHTLLIHLSDENGKGWTTFAVDRKTREWSVAQRTRQLDAAMAAHGLLYR